MAMVEPLQEVSYFSTSFYMYPRILEPSGVDSFIITIICSVLSMAKNGVMN